MTLTVAKVTFPLVPLMESPVVSLMSPLSPFINADVPRDTFPLAPGPLESAARPLFNSISPLFAEYASPLDIRTEPERDACEDCITTSPLEPYCDSPEVTRTTPEEEETLFEADPLERIVSPLAALDEEGGDLTRVAWRANF